MTVTEGDTGVDAVTVDVAVDVAGTDCAPRCWSRVRDSLAGERMAGVAEAETACRSLPLYPTAEALLGTDAPRCTAEEGFTIPAWRTGDMAKSAAETAASADAPAPPPGEPEAAVARWPAARAEAEAEASEGREAAMLRGWLPALPTWPSPPPLRVSTPVVPPALLLPWLLPSLLLLLLPLFVRSGARRARREAGNVSSPPPASSPPDPTPAAPAAPTPEGAWPATWAATWAGAEPWGDESLTDRASGAAPCTSPPPAAAAAPAHAPAATPAAGPLVPSLIAGLDGDGTAGPAARGAALVPAGPAGNAAGCWIAAVDVVVAPWSG